MPLTINDYQCTQRGFFHWRLPTSTEEPSWHFNILWSDETHHEDMLIHITFASGRQNSVDSRALLY